MRKIFTLFLLTLSVCTTSPNQSSSVPAARRDSATASALDLPLAELLRRADSFSANRQFPEARAHWEKVLVSFPEDPGVSRALFGIARSYMWERQYDRAVPYFQRLVAQFPNTKDGREGLAFLGATYVRMQWNKEAAETYRRYTEQYPNGERIESAHLNLIDALREAGKYDDAEQWVNKTRLRFAGKPTEVNALHALLRMQIFTQHWGDALKAADELLAAGRFAGSMTSADEAKYLKGVALQLSGRRAEAATVFGGLAANRASYFGGLTAARQGGQSVERTVLAGVSSYGDYPIVYGDQVVRQARLNKIDPRFVLAIMKQESSFKPGAKSPAGARGLLQLVYDTAIKYDNRAGISLLGPDDLYAPATNIAIGSVYLGELKKEFGGLYEAIAASYNGGEDNVARWMNRSRPKDPGIFVAEIGFAESKNYVFKVMGNYRAYCDLYNEDLTRR